MLPQATALAESGLAAYQDSRLEFAEVLSASLEISRLNNEYWQILADHETAIARIEEITGLSLRSTQRLTGGDAMNNYRSAFWLAVAGNLALAGVLGVFWWRSRHGKTWCRRREAAASMQPAKASEPSAMRGDAGRAGACAHSVVIAADSGRSLKLRESDAQGRAR